MMMLRANLIEPRKLILEQAPVPMPGSGQVRLKIETCGVCGSDIHAYYGEHPYIQCPIAPGHEFAGRIDMLGSDVTGWQIGQAVLTEPSLVCGQCENCRNGKYNICDNLKVIGCQSDGGFAEYLVVPANKLIEMSAGMTFEQGSFVEPLAVGVHGLREAPINADSRLLILGAGTIGLMHLLTAHAWGIKDITITDTIQSKLDLALELGATHAVNVKQTPLADFCSDLYGAERIFDVAIECVGVGGTVRDGMLALKKGGTMVVVGVFPHEVPVNMGLVQDRELKLRGSLMYRMEDFIEARDLIASGRAPIDTLITARYPLDQIAAAMTAIDEHPERNIKTMIHIRPQPAVSQP
ncbi:MAG: alcohol dehydrogenase catalytic domain-containing protein [Chloroflexota bacterium]